MADFQQLKGLQVVAEKTVPYTLYQVAGEPVLHLAPATEANRPYFNGLLKRSRRNRQRIQAGAFDARVLSDNRDDDRVLYSQFIVKAWEKVVDSKNQPVDFNQENVLDFLNALPNWIFDDLRLFANDSQNFIESPTIDAEEAAGNLPSA